ncbi:MAG: hypothetical protein K2W82_16875 [Candidatus Obscuribacterales bacterium]|nr:hypothetical protein [Candidatus Obscuribacterales bacterium]
MRRVFQIILSLAAALTFVQEYERSALATTPSARSEREKGVSDLIDQMMPYMTPETCTPANQEKMAKILDAAHKRGTSYQNIIFLAIERNWKLREEGKPHYRYRVEAGNDAVIGVSHPDPKDPLRSLPGRQILLKFKPSQDGKSIQSDGHKTRDIPAE